MWQCDTVRNVNFIFNASRCAKRIAALQCKRYSSLSITPYPHLAYITDIDLTQPIAPSNGHLLNTVLATAHILLFRQKLTNPSQLADLARVFSSELQQHGKDKDEVYRYIVQNRSKQMRGSDFWHSDLSYLPFPAHCTLLYAVDIPDDCPHGNTQFINMQYRYEALPDRLKQYYSTLNAHHSIEHNNGFPIDSYDDLEIPTATDALHPLIRKHPVSGKLVIYANPAFTHKVVSRETGEDIPNSDEILEELFDHCLSANYVFEHEWNVGDILVWDNMSLIHRATTIDMPRDLRREMFRSCALSVATKVEVEYH